MDRPWAASSARPALPTDRCGSSVRWCRGVIPSGSKTLRSTKRRISRARPKLWSAKRIWSEPEVLRTIDLNSDMGESFGRWQLGNDAELMEVITSANIACGWHGGDPAVMRTTVEMAVVKGGGIGAHVGLPDLLGFGRRRMQVTQDEIYDYTMYQSGALRAFAEAAGSRLQHVKPHGAFYTMSAADEALAASLVRAVGVLGDGVVLYGMGEIEPALAKQAGVGYVREGYVDLN